MSVTHRSIRFAINTPGGIVYEWRDDRAKEIIERARATAPVNNPANARHRGGKVGTYKRMFRWERGRSSSDTLTAIIRNRAPHAVYVEAGRSASRKYQRFSWTGWGGQIRYIGKRPKFMFEGLPRGRERRGQALASRIAAWQASTEHGTPWGGHKTNARKPRNTMRNAINYVMVPWGFTRL